MNKIEEIITSWLISYDPNNEQSELAAKRIEICDSCEFKIVRLNIPICSACGCPLSRKVFTPVGSCIKKKW